MFLHMGRAGAGAVGVKEVSSATSMDEKTRIAHLIPFHNAANMLTKTVKFALYQS